MAGNNERHESSMMEELPPELMVKVLAFTDIPTRAKLALCSLSLQQRVYRDCPQVWTNVDLSYSYHITDLGLYRFLTRINAKEVTKTLDLKYCSQLRGSGLMPIRNSRVLEHIDLLWTCANTDPLPFLSILRISIPYSLNHVELSTHSSGMNSDVTRDFMRCLREAKSIQAEDQHVRCRSCQLPVVDALRQLVPNRFGPPVMKCLNCKGDFCRRASCPMDVRECGFCGKSFCRDCKFRGEKCIFQCSDCKNNYCTKTCANRYECKSARKYLASVAIAFDCVVVAKVTLYVEIVVLFRTCRNAMMMTASFATIAGRLEDVTTAMTMSVAVVSLYPHVIDVGRGTAAKMLAHSSWNVVGRASFDSAGTVMILSSVAIDAMQGFASHMIGSWTARHVTCAIVELVTTMSTSAAFVPGHVSRIAHAPIGSQQKGQRQRDSVLDRYEVSVYV